MQAQIVGPHEIALARHPDDAQSPGPESLIDQGRQVVNGRDGLHGGRVMGHAGAVDQQRRWLLALAVWLRGSQGLRQQVCRL